MKIFLSICFVNLFILELNGEEWPWNFKKFPACTGKRQSPVNIDGRFLVTKENSRNPLVFINYDVMPTEMLLENTGDSVKVKALYTNISTPYIMGGHLKGARYIYEQFHFHWGSNNDYGSEHLVNGQSYPIEVHFVHYNAKYSSYLEARNKPDGLLVIAVFGMIQSGGNKPFETVAIQLHRIAAAGSTVLSHSTFAITEILRKFHTNYVTYLGSLTTPPCTENVNWIISPHAFHVYSDELELLRESLRSEKNAVISSNLRPSQERNGRFFYLYTDTKPLTDPGNQI